mgnify:CR=1 FL=1
MVTPLCHSHFPSFDSYLNLFTTGSTEEYNTMVDEVRALYPNTSLIAVGFSMGANIVLKYLGESHENQSKFKAAMSICQGYDAEA